MITSSSLLEYNTVDIKKTLDTKIIELSNDGYYDYMPYPKYTLQSPVSGSKYSWGDSIVIKWDYLEPRNNLIPLTQIDYIGYYREEAKEPVRIFTDIPTSDKNVMWKVPFVGLEPIITDYKIKIYSFLDDTEISDTSSFFNLKPKTSDSPLILEGTGEGDATLTIYGFIPNVTTSSLYEDAVANGKPSYNFVVSESRNFRFNYDTSNAVQVYIEKLSDPVFIEQLSPGFGIYTVEDVRMNETYTISAKDYVGKIKKASLSITEYVTPFDPLSPSARDCIFAEGNGNALLRLCGFVPNVTESRNVFIVSQSKDFRFNYSSSNAMSVFLEKQSDSAYIQELGTSYGTFVIENLINDDKYRASVIDDNGNTKIINFGIKVFKYAATQEELSKMTLYEFTKYSLSLAEESMTSADSILTFVGEDGNITTSKFVDFIPIYKKEIDEMSNDTPCKTVAMLCVSIFEDIIFPLENATGKITTRSGEVYYNVLSTKGYLGISTLREKIKNVGKEYNYRKEFNNFCGYVELIYPAAFESDVAVPTLFTWKVDSASISFYGEDGLLRPYFVFDLQVSTDDKFNNIIVYKENIGSFMCEVTELKNSMTYYWRVRLKNMQTNTINVWTNGFKFGTISAGKASKPVLILPNINSTVTTPLLFKWNRQPEGIKYRFEISDNVSFYRKSISVETDVESYLLVDNLPINTIYFWRVQAFNNQSTSLWSEVYYYSLFRNNEQIHTNINELDFADVTTNTYSILQYEVWAENIKLIDFGPTEINISVPGEYKVAELKDDGTSQYNNSINLTVDATGKLKKTIIYVKFSPTVSGQTIGTILHRTTFPTNLTSKEITVKGNGVSGTPTTTPGNIILTETNGNPISALWSDFELVNVGSSKQKLYNVATTVVPDDLHIKAPNGYFLSRWNPDVFDVNELILSKDNNNIVPQTAVQVKFKPPSSGIYNSQILHYVGDINTSTIKKELIVKGHTAGYGNLGISFVGQPPGEGFLDFGNVEVGKVKTLQYLIYTSQAIPGDVYITAPNGYLISEPPYTSYVKNITLIRNSSGKINGDSAQIQIRVNFAPIDKVLYSDSILNVVQNSDQFQVVPVKGTGISATPIIPPKISLNPTSLDFGDVNIDFPQQFPVKSYFLTDTGVNSDIQISTDRININDIGISFSEAGPFEDFLVIPKNSPNINRYIYVKFMPGDIRPYVMYIKHYGIDLNIDFEIKGNGFREIP